MNKWKICYFNEAVKVEIFGLPKKLLARYLALSDRMTIMGPDLGYPHTSPMDDSGLFEIRVKAMEGIARVFYCVKVGHEIWMLHSFVKKSPKTPLKEIRLAQTRLKEIIK